MRDPESVVGAILIAAAILAAAGALFVLVVSLAPPAIRIPTRAWITRSTDSMIEFLGRAAPGCAVVAVLAVFALLLAAISSLFVSR